MKCIVVWASIQFGAHVDGATIHVTGPDERQVEFGDGTTSFATLSGGEGFINSSVTVNSPDFVTTTGTSVNEMMALIREQQTAIIAQQAEISALKQFVGIGRPAPSLPPSAPPYPPGTELPTFSEVALHTFNGSMSSVVKIDDPGACAQGNSPRTIIMWLKAEALGFGIYGLVDPSNNTQVSCAGEGFQIQASTDRVGVHGWCRDYFHNIVWPLQTWKHFAVTFTGSAATIYLDGQAMPGNSQGSYFGHDGHHIRNGLANDCSLGVYYGGYAENNVLTGEAAGFRFFNDVALPQASVQFFMGLDDPR